MNETPQEEFSRWVGLTATAEQSQSIRIEADADERRRLAERFELIDLSKLEARLEIQGDPAGRSFWLSGAYDADVTQSCVVTLDPVTSMLTGPIVRQYSLADLSATEEVIEIDPEAEDPPEVIAERRIDVGMVVAEQLGLDLDPFPRAPGAEIAGAAVDEAESESEPNASNPFAVLKNLRR